MDISGKGFSHPKQKPVQVILTRTWISSLPPSAQKLPLGTSYACSLSCSWAPPSQENTFWFILSLKHLWCDILGGAPLCSVPDAINNPAFSFAILRNPRFLCLVPQNHTRVKSKAVGVSSLSQVWNHCKSLYECVVVILVGTFDTNYSSVILQKN